MTIASEFLLNIGLTLPDTETSEASLRLNLLTCSAAASPVQTFPTLDSRQELTARSQASGQNMSDSFAWYDLATCSWRTWQRCLDGEWGEFLETFPQAGMTRNGTVSELQTLQDRTSETEYGFWPTPRSSEIAAKSSMETVANITDPKGNLEEAVYSHWATPTSRDWKDSGDISQCPENSLLGRQAKSSAGKTESKGFVNPDFHLWLMGYPTQWNALNPAETPSSPPLLSGLEIESLSAKEPQSKDAELLRKVASWFETDARQELWGWRQRTAAELRRIADELVSK